VNPINKMTVIISTVFMVVNFEIIFTSDYQDSINHKIDRVLASK
jgi:hypothetical protein